jgi:hypothetical protein
MNDILIAALQAKYNMEWTEAVERVCDAKNSGNLSELYQCMLMKFLEEVKDNV